MHQADMASNRINEDETIWRRHLAKRLAGVRFVKATADYAACCSRPPTPDPFDRTVTKRKWEKSMQDFRRALRAPAPRNLPDGFGGLEEEMPLTAANPLDVQAAEKPPAIAPGTLSRH